MVKDGIYYATQFREKNISINEWIKEREKRIIDLQKEINLFAEWDTADAKKIYWNQKPLKGPFEGLPIPLKMLGQEKEGLGATAGSCLLQGNRATSTDNFVKALETAGFVPFGKTNVPEFGFKNVTDSVLYGVARNPWNREYSPGGSSGGAAAAVASGLFPIAAASDGGGSIRIPASFCGLIGLKPTRGTMPVGPDSWRSWQGAAINFALTVSMRDTKSLFYHLRGVENAAPYHAPRSEWLHQNSTKKKILKVAFFTASPVGTSVSKEAIKAVTKASAFLEGLGHEVTQVASPVQGRQLMESYYLMNGAETVAMFDKIQDQIRRPLSLDDMELMTWGIYQYGKRTCANRYIQALEIWDQASFQVERLFEDYDLLLTPTTADIAPKVEMNLCNDEIREKLIQANQLSFSQLKEVVYEMFEKSLAITPFTQLANLGGQPAISLPTHLTESGMPLGIQFMAAKGREDLLFQVGELFERAEKFVLPKYY